MFSQAIGIDLGTATTVAVSARGSIVYQEPSVIAVRRDTRAVVAVGTEAHSMIGRTPDSITPIRPIQGGVISDLNHSTELLRHLLRKIARSRWLRPRVVLAVPGSATDVSRRALADAAVQAGAGEVYLLDETVAAALGAGLPVAEPVGSLLVDVGSGTTDVAVISLGSAVVAASSTAAGDQMDDAVAKMLKRDHQLLIGGPTAERVKTEFGSALPGPAGETLVRGRHMTTGNPTVARVPIAGICGALEETLAQIDNLILTVLEQTPPELLADISRSGLTLTGGGAHLRGLDERLARVTRLPVRVAPTPESAVALGTGMALERQGAIRLHRFKSR